MVKKISPQLKYYYRNKEYLNKKRRVKWKTKENGDPVVYADRPYKVREGVWGDKTQYERDLFVSQYKYSEQLHRKDYGPEVDALLLLFYIHNCFEGYLREDFGKKILDINATIFLRNRIWEHKDIEKYLKNTGRGEVSIRHRTALANVIGLKYSTMGIGGRELRYSMTIYTPVRDNLLPEDLAKHPLPYFNKAYLVDREKPNFEVIIKDVVKKVNMIRALCFKEIITDEILEKVQKEFWHIRDDKEGTFKQQERSVLDVI